ncbi:MAG: hypothetical protein COA79_01830 [Planctomycetota bacterium]|nr:MAG: hypothetical protein COA79_01830 [Planctomycetota bacterium]
MEPLIEVENFVYAVASDSPTPGGGSVAGIIGSLGAALGSMVCNFTAGKKKFAEYDKEASEAIHSLNNDIQNLLELAEKDMRSYNLVGKAFQLPKSNDQEKKARSDAIEHACEMALKAPFEVMKICKRLIIQTSRISEYGNPMLDSDTAGAGILLHAAAETAFYCVHANLPFIKNEEKNQNISKSINEIIQETKKEKDIILARVTFRMNL